MSTPQAQTPDLTSYDVILVNTSAGKDSQAMLDYVAELARAAGVEDRIVAVHCDLGRVEWQGTMELAEEQVAQYGYRFEVVRRELGDLLDQIEARGMFPSNNARYCTSDHKTAQVKKLITKLTAERAHLGRQVRILNCLGIRAAESPARAKKAAFEHEASASNGRRHVDRWLPIFGWCTEQVWDRIRAAGTRHHPAYDLGMTRLSCCFCVLASKGDLLISVKANRELADEYAAVEVRIGHRFTQDLSMAELIAQADADVEAEAQAVVAAGQLALFA